MDAESYGTISQQRRDPYTIDNWLIVRSGFLQHKGSIGNGCVRLAAMLDHRFGGGGTRVELEAWNDSVAHTAECIYRLGPKTKPPNVAIFAYSWGCGFGFTRLARELDRRGISVRCAVLSDPVYHGLCRWRALIPRTLFRRIKVVVPPNVQSVHWFRQRVNRPAGHDLRFESPYTRELTCEELEVRHQEMDNHPRFHARCMDVAEELVRTD